MPTPKATEDELLYLSAKFEGATPVAKLKSLRAFVQKLIKKAEKLADFQAKKLKAEKKSAKEAKKKAKKAKEKKTKGHKAK